MKRALSLLVLGFFLYKLAPTQADPDLWGHVRFGGDLLRTGQAVRADVYSYASGIVPWINHELLSEAAFHLAWVAAGGTGLVLLKVLVGMLVAGGLWRHMLGAGLPAVRAGILLIVASFALLPSLGTVRPQMFTVLFFAALILVLHAAEHGRSALLWTLPPLLAVWINFHGGVLAGLAVVLVYAAASMGLRLVRREQPALRDWLFPVACAAALLLNPFGVALPEFLLRTATVARPEITEWGPLRIVSVEGAAYALLLAASGAALVRHANRTTPALVAVYCVVAVAPLTAVRHVSLFAITALVVGAGPLAALWSDVAGHRAEGVGAAGVDDGKVSRVAPERGPGLFERPAGQWTLLAAGGLFVALALPHFRTVVMGPTFEHPARAVDLLERSGVEGRLAVDFDWGEYALWHLYPEILVAPDGRRETVYDGATYRRYVAFAFGAGDWDAFLKHPPADLALVPRGTPAANLLELDPAWELVHADSTAVLFARSGFIGAVAIRATPAGEIPSDGGGLEFPGS
jgi:hypothetical protein